MKNKLLEVLLLASSCVFTAVALNACRDQTDRVTPAIGTLTTVTAPATATTNPASLAQIALG